MMKIGDPVYRGSEVHLPPEVLAFIIINVTASHSLQCQATLWSCCLVNKSWYSASISHLYYHPLFTNRNFDKFTETICPRSGSRKSRLGLENFVKHLDLGRLAYESSKSLTARLISRTKNSIESFISPAVTFS